MGPSPSLLIPPVAPWLLCKGPEKFSWLPLATVKVVTAFIAVSAAIVETTPPPMVTAVFRRYRPPQSASPPVPLMLPPLNSSPLRTVLPRLLINQVPPAFTVILPTFPPCHSLPVVQSTAETKVAPFWMVMVPAPKLE